MSQLERNQRLNWNVYCIYRLKMSDLHDVGLAPNQAIRI